MKYINTKTGITFESKCLISGADYKEVKAENKKEAKEEVKAETKKKK